MPTCVDAGDGDSVTKELSGARPRCTARDGRRCGEAVGGWPPLHSVRQLFATPLRPAPALRHDRPGTTRRDVRAYA